MLLNTVVWGAALPLVKPGLEVTTAFRFLFERFTLASLLVIPLLWWFWRNRPSLRVSLPKIIGLELLGTTVALSLLYLGLERTSALEASLIATTTPIFTTLGGIIFLHEKEERREWIGLGVALFGTLLLVGEPLISGSWRGAEFSFLGNVMIFLQNIAIATYYLLAKKYYRGLPKLFVASVSFVVGMISFGVISLLEVGGSIGGLATAVRLDLGVPAVWLAVGYMATLGSIVGLTAYIKGQDGIEASEASLFTYLQPLVYVPLSWMIFGDSLSPFLLLALAVIASGVLIAESKRSG